MTQQPLKENGIVVTSTTYDAFVHHVYVSQELFDLVPNPRLILSIVRRPSLRLQSAWAYFHLQKTLHKSFAQVTSALTNESTSLRMIEELHRVSANTFQRSKKTKNTEGLRGDFKGLLDCMSQELTGSKADKQHARLYRLDKYNTFHSTSEVEVEKQQLTNVKVSTNSRDNTYDEFDNEFSLLLDKIREFQWFIMVAERMDESLLILQKLMHWGTTETATNRAVEEEVDVEAKEEEKRFESLLYIPQKVKDQYKNDVKITKELTLQRLDDIQPYDKILYQVANKTLDKLISMAYGGNKVKFQRDLQAFKQVPKQRQLLCANLLAPTVSPTLQPVVPRRRRRKRHERKSNGEMKQLPVNDANNQGGEDQGGDENEDERRSLKKTRGTKSVFSFRKKKQKKQKQENEEATMALLKQVCEDMERDSKDAIIHYHAYKLIQKNSESK